LLGDNGSGKSTLLKIITGEAAPDRGEIKLGASVSYGHLPQVITFANEEQSVLEMIRMTLAVTEAEARHILARFRFKREDVYKRLDSLSGGERSRLYLCLLMQKQLNLLILDEPTNHLDIESREWLEAALSEFGGSIFFVSHDRYFIDKFAARVLEVHQGRLVDYAGGYEFFRQKRKEATATPIRSAPLTRPVAKPLRSTVKEKAATTRETVENEIRELERRRGELELEMSLHNSNYAALDELFRQKAVIEDKIAQLYQVWLEACDCKQS
jgi:ATPase subunit of ABC transporter with duplicated ATPase domains